MQLLSIAFVAALLVQFAATLQGIYHFMGWWCLIFPIILFSFPPIVIVIARIMAPFSTILAFYVAVHLWGWPWPVALLMVCPILLLFVPLGVALLGLSLKEKIDSMGAVRPLVGTSPTDVFSPQPVSNQRRPLLLHGPSVSAPPVPYSAHPLKKPMSTFVIFLIPIVIAAILGLLALLLPPNRYQNGDRTWPNSQPLSYISASDLYAKAKASFESKDYPGALSSLAEIVLRYPNSPESASARTSIVNIKSIQANEERLGRQKTLWVYKPGMEYGTSLTLGGWYDYGAQISSMNDSNSFLQIHHMVNHDKTMSVVSIPIVTSSLPESCTPVGSRCVFSISVNSVVYPGVVWITTGVGVDSKNRMIAMLPPEKGSMIMSGWSDDMMFGVDFNTPQGDGPVSRNTRPRWVVFDLGGLDISRLGLTPSSMASIELETIRTFDVLLGRLSPTIESFDGPLLGHSPPSSETSSDSADQAAQPADYLHVEP